MILDDPLAQEPVENEQDLPETETVSAPLSLLARLRRVVPRAVSIESLPHFFATREPTLGAAFLAMLGVAILMSLGTWQVMRSQEKNRLIAQVQSDLTASPHDLSALAPQADDEWAALHFKPVTLRGTWMPLRYFRLAPRSYAEQVGYQWIIPFQLENGQVILVNRGFVPNNVTLVPPSGSDVTTLSGVAYMPEHDRPRFVPDNRPAKGEWIWTDINAMGHEIGVKDIAPVVVYENRIEGKDSYPIGGQIPLPFHNRHWHYAVTWYCLALALMGVWMLAIGPKTPHQTEDAKNDAVEGMDPVARRDLYPEATD